MDCGHYIAEEAPTQLLSEMQVFFKADAAGQPFGPEGDHG